MSLPYTCAEQPSAKQGNGGFSALNLPAIAENAENYFADLTFILSTNSCIAG